MPTGLTVRHPITAEAIPLWVATNVSWLWRGLRVRGCPRT